MPGAGNISSVLFCFCTWSVLNLEIPASTLIFVVFGLLSVSFENSHFILREKNSTLNHR